ncbi:MAG: phospholipase [Geminicoccaceae bacterium]|jgi:phosphatidylserine/phosphatidylglycerophosphate/cardiolipin synthase-like enzyme|nr:phospholipase [Geminicoccaceae bacterium]
MTLPESEPARRLPSAGVLKAARTHMKQRGGGCSIRPHAGPILRVGRNCGTIAAARRAAVIVDAARYFAALHSVLRKAERSVLILGWDFDAGIALHPDSRQSEQLGNFLRALVEERPTLEVRVLVWNLATVHSPGATAPLLFGASWHEHPRIRVALDSLHPIYAAQHQKIVCVDSIAFVGGIDLTVERWDTTRHAPNDGGRTSPDGGAYRPVHDLQWMIDGAAAQAVCRIARERWRVVTGETITSSTSSLDPWPSDVEPDFENVPMAVARTAPAYNGAPEVREVETLVLDALVAAKSRIYIETQYFAEPRIADVLARHLAREGGPEIVVVVSRAARGVIEKWVMGNNRDRLVRRLRRADRHGRFRAYCPVVRGSSQVEILVHSKLLVVDDQFLKIGSSNLNRRSMGLDAECDMALEAGEQRTAAGIRAVRNRVIAEHLGKTAGAFAEAARSTGSIIAAIERLNDGPRRLEGLGIRDRGPTHVMPGTRILDPLTPFRLSSLLWRRH